MATFKAEVYAHQKRADGTYNIKIRVIHQKRKKYIPTTYYVTKDDLTRTTFKLKNQKYIDATDDMIKKYRSICDRMGERLKSMTVEQVVDAITNDNGEHFDLDIVAYARQYILHLKETGHTGNALSYQVAINNLVRFVGRDSVSIKEITVKFINDWIKWIKENPARSKPEANHGERAQSLYISQLRAIHNRAKKEFNDEDAGLIRIPYSPFKRVEIPKVPVTRKRAISTDLLRKFSELPYSLIMQPGTNRYNLAKDVFLLSFCLIGMNAVDLYTCTDLKKGRITYQRTKTKNRRAAINKGLKKIGDDLGIDDLEFYAARHTWATIASNEAGVDKYTVHTALNHVDENMRVTDIYIAKSWDSIDAANRKVLDYVKLSLDDVTEKKYIPKNKRVLPKQNL